MYITLRLEKFYNNEEALFEKLDSLLLFSNIAIAYRMYITLIGSEKFHKEEALFEKLHSKQATWLQLLTDGSTKVSYIFVTKYFIKRRRRG